jgi:hypothetical protein
MALTREQAAERARDAAARLLESLDGQKRVARFVERYVSECGRPELTAGPMRHRELLATITREALLAAAAKVLASLPGRLSRKDTPVLSGPEAEAADTFREEFLESLGKKMLWLAAEREEFRRDLEIYGHVAARLARLGRPRRGGDPPEGAFVDRCALLLDPSMLDAARRAAGRFQAELEQLAEDALKAAFRRKRGQN